MNVAEKLPELPLLDATSSPQEIFRSGHEIAGAKVKLACSFSVEDVVIIDLLRDSLEDVSVFAIDTGRLNEETYAIAEDVSQRYGVKIDWYFPQQSAVEQLSREKGLFSFRDSLDNRKQCCHIRKVEPLQRALLGASAWMTGMRRAQGVTRNEQQALEIDHVNGGILKVNPLTFWSDDLLWTYAKEKRLPLNALYQQGYASIGCAPCTRAVGAGESSRDGRWWWENAEHRECGLHRR
ncbi:MAG: phosphoadenylyl-sulfate reductase [Desulfuromonadales bacterium]|nr:phosphoadenylyl-sulfate reductase [Desulfuromonadales bacterium]